MPTDETFTFADEPLPAKPTPQDPAQVLLTWLQRWPSNLITSKQIYQFAPRSIRNRETAIRSAQTLVDCGWLTIQKPRQRNYRIWQIHRKGPVVHPTVAG